MRQPILNWEQLQAYTGGDPEFEVEILTLFVQHTGLQIEALQEAWTHQDLNKIVELTHQLKGSCGNIGAYALQCLITQLEHCAQHQELLALSDFFRTLGPEFERVVGEIEPYLLSRAE